MTRSGGRHHLWHVHGPSWPGPTAARAPPKPLSAGLGSGLAASVGLLARSSGPLLLMLLGRFLPSPSPLRRSPLSASLSSLPASLFPPLLASDSTSPSWALATGTPHERRDPTTLRMPRGGVGSTRICASEPAPSGPGTNRNCAECPRFGFAIHCFAMVAQPPDHLAAGAGAGAQGHVERRSRCRTVQQFL